MKRVSDPPSVDEDVEEEQASGELIPAKESKDQSIMSMLVS